MASMRNSNSFLTLPDLTNQKINIKQEYTKQQPLPMDTTTSYGSTEDPNNAILDNPAALPPSVYQNSLLSDMHHMDSSKLSEITQLAGIPTPLVSSGTEVPQNDIVATAFASTVLTSLCKSSTSCAIAPTLSDTVPIPLDTPTTSAIEIPTSWSADQVRYLIEQISTNTAVTPCGIPATTITPPSREYTTKSIEPTCTSTPMTTTTPTIQPAQLSTLTSPATSCLYPTVTYTPVGTTTSLPVGLAPPSAYPQNVTTTADNNKLLTTSTVTTTTPIMMSTTSDTTPPISTTYRPICEDISSDDDDDTENDTYKFPEINPSQRQFVENDSLGNYAPPASEMFQSNSFQMIPKHGRIYRANRYNQLVEMQFKPGQVYQADMNGNLLQIGLFKLTI